MFIIRFERSINQPLGWWKTAIADFNIVTHPVCVTYYSPVTQQVHYTLFMRDPSYNSLRVKATEMLHYQLEHLQGTDWMDCGVHCNILGVTTQTTRMLAYTAAIKNAYHGSYPGWDVLFRQRTMEIHDEFTIEALNTGDWLLAAYLSDNYVYHSIRHYSNEDDRIDAQYFFESEAASGSYYILNILDTEEN